MDEIHNEAGRQASLWGFLLVCLPLEDVGNRIGHGGAQSKDETYDYRG
jgi:hypothetical protein